MKILVTGGTGVIGTAAIPALLKRGHDVRLLSRHADRDAARFPDRVEPFEADLSQPDRLRDAVAGCAAVVHIAGIVDEEPPEITFEKINVAGTRALRDAASAGGAPFFIYVSSLGADRGESEYHRSKLRAEAVVREYSGPWLILRPGNVYGPGDETLSMLLKMVRNLPALPIVQAGDQPFQPLWCADFGAAIADAVGRPELSGQTLEIAGPDVTTTTAVLDQLAAITGRNPPRLAVPAWLAQFGAKTAEARDGFGKKLLRGAGFEPPINTAKLQMLLEGSVIPGDHANALVTVFAVEPTPLQDGLEQLADMLPEQPPGEGFGAVERTTYTAEIDGSPHSAAALVDLVMERITEIMPLEFAAEPGAPAAAVPGATMTGDLPGRGHFQVRLDERTATSATFVTIEGHPLAGVLTFAIESDGSHLRFSIEIVAQSSNAIDWLAMWTFGRAMQSQNWRAVVRRVVALSGGTAPAGVRKSTTSLDEAETAEVTSRVRAIAAGRERAETERALRAEPN